MKEDRNYYRNGLEIKSKEGNYMIYPNDKSLNCLIQTSLTQKRYDQLLEIFRTMGYKNTSVSKMIRDGVIVPFIKDNLWRTRR